MMKCSIHKSMRQSKALLRGDAPPRGLTQEKRSPSLKELVFYLNNACRECVMLPTAETFNFAFVFSAETRTQGFLQTRQVSLPIVLLAQPLETRFTCSQPKEDQYLTLQIC